MIEAGSGARNPRNRTFSFSRSRGVVWVCDIAGSSKYLNNDTSANQLEEFLPRLYRTASIMVEAAGGEFIKWTGDGFLAWFETPLHREVGRIVSNVFEAAFHLTVLINVTQLGTSPERKFKLRHGVTFEHDALVTSIADDIGSSSLDLIGRSVVLAFRLSGVDAGFPGIVTQRELVDSHQRHGPSHFNFHRWQASHDERLKFFKGEKWGTSSIYVSDSARVRRLTQKGLVRNAKRAIAAAEGKREPRYPFEDVWKRFDPVFLAGPPWCKEVMDDYLQFVVKDLLGSLKKAVGQIESATPPDND